jgi:predicted pyridoxine 5'-phosphate oxidase superfamily flavin-nucleotide-binding protein
MARSRDVPQLKSSSCGVAFTEAVKAAQAHHGSRHAYARLEAKGGWPKEITPALADFVARLDTFFLATASAAGQPYVQHRGGPKGFLKAIGPHSLAFADYAGNRQYITVGNLSENECVMLFLLDFETRTRVKVWGRARVVEDDPILLADLALPDYRAKPERAIVIDIVGWDANCRQHITARIRQVECERRIAELEARIAELEAPRGARTSRSQAQSTESARAPSLKKFEVDPATRENGE